MLLGVLSLGLLLMIFGLSGVGMLRRVYFGLILKLEDPLKLAALPFLAEVCYGFVTGVWEAELLEVRVSSRLYRVSHGDDVDVRCSQYTLFTLLFLLFYSRGLRRYQESRVYSV